MTASTAPHSVPPDWPHRDASRSVHSSALVWHVQVMGSGPAILLIHGSGAASHSWRDVGPLLAREFTVLIPDLPGHGFTSRPDDDHLTLEAIAATLDALLDTMGADPIALVGHSAGGALALRLAIRRASRNSIRAVIGVNAALTPPRESIPAAAFAMRALARSSVAGSLTARLASSDALFGAVMRSTGSTLPSDQLERYQAFASSADHVNALLTMFAAWDMSQLSASLPQLTTPVTLIVGTNDHWIPPVQSRRIALTLPHARVVEIPGAGHLAHEEFPERVAAIIANATREASVTGDSSQGTTGTE